MPGLQRAKKYRPGPFPIALNYVNYFTSKAAEQTLVYAFESMS